MFHSVDTGNASGIPNRPERSRDLAFEAFVSSEDDLVGRIAFALHERQFAEWQAEMLRICGRPPTVDEIRAHQIGETTPRRIKAYRYLAEQSLQGSHKTAQAPYSDDPDFERFCASEHDFVGMIAFAIHEQQVKEWRDAIFRAHRRGPTSDEERAHRVSETCPRRILAYRVLAAERLAGRGPDLTPGVAKVSFILRALSKGEREPAERTRASRAWAFWRKTW